MIDGHDALSENEELRRALRHELGQPLTALLTRAELLSMKLRRAGLDDEARSADAIGAAARRLDALMSGTWRARA